MDIEKLRLTEMEKFALEYPPDGGRNVTNLIDLAANAQIAKALWGIADWLEEEGYGDRDWSPGLPGRYLWAKLKAAGIPKPETE